MDPGAAHHLQHPALGGFGPLTQNLLSPRTLLYIWRYAPCVWTYHLIVIEILHKKSSVCLLKNISIQSGIMALFFFQESHPFYIIQMVNIIHWHNLRYIFFFSLTENKYQKVVYLLSNVFLLALYNDIF